MIQESKGSIKIKFKILNGVPHIFIEEYWVPFVHEERTKAC